MQYQYKELKMPNPGVLQFDVPDDIMEELRHQANKLENLNAAQQKLVSHNKNLVGQIARESRLNQSSAIKDFLLNLGEKYNQHFEINTIHKKLSIEGLWMNFQKAGEYNPPHVHSGVLSFVIWVKIPYKLEDEDRHENSINSNYKYNGRFAFTYNKNWGGTHSFYLDVDSSYEGKGVIFTNSAIHQVFPFYTSDQYRISVAGNFI